MVSSSAVRKRLQVHATQTQTVLLITLTPKAVSEYCLPYVPGKLYIVHSQSEKEKLTVSPVQYIIIYRHAESLASTW